MTREEIEALEELIPLRQAGVMIGVPYETMRRYVKQRKIPYYKVFGRIKIRMAEIRSLYQIWRVPALDATECPAIDARQVETEKSDPR